MARIEESQAVKAFRDAKTGKEKVYSWGSQTPGRDMGGLYQVLKLFADKAPWLAGAPLSFGANTNRLKAFRPLVARLTVSTADTWIESPVVLGRNAVTRALVTEHQVSL